MPTTDIIRMALIVLLVGALLGLAGWFSAEVVGVVIASGEAATNALQGDAADGFQAVTAMFGYWWSEVWGAALAIVGTFATGLFGFRLLRWAVGS